MEVTAVNVTAATTTMALPALTSTNASKTSTKTPAEQVTPAKIYRDHTAVYATEDKFTAKVRVKKHMSVKTIIM